MQADQRVYLKSDRAGRALVLAFCLAPVLVPAVTIGAVSALREWPLVDWALPAALTSSAQAAAPLPIEPLARPMLGILPEPHSFHSSLFDDPVQPPMRFQPSGQSLIAKMPTDREAWQEGEPVPLRPSQ